MHLTLLIDADDTLWENNIYFERAFQEFAAFLDHSTLSPVEVRAILDEIEMVNNRIHGYGSLNFARNLRECYEHLAEREIREVDLRTVMSFAERILDHPIELMEGVPETLAYLSRRHQLILCTKGNRDEQKLKLDRSGLNLFFKHTTILKEKDEEAYQSILRDRGLATGHTWMIGNSPKSDINPALRIGMNAAYVPHPRTWHLERQEIVSGPGRLLRIDKFAQLKEHF